MNLVDIKKIYKIKKKYCFLRNKAKKFIRRGENIFFQAREKDNVTGKISSCYVTVQYIIGLIGIGYGYLMDHIYLKKIKKELIRQRIYRNDEIAIDINELTDMQGRAKVLLGSIDYRANIKKSYLNNLELIWGDACFLALDDAKYIKNLEVVLGKLQVRDLNCPLALKITGKEADFSRITDKKMLPKYVMADRKSVV